MQSKFKPGENLRLLKDGTLVACSPKLFVAFTTVPGRIGWTVCDMTLFGPGKPGGGGLGMAIDIFSQVFVRLSATEKIISERPTLVKHYVLLFKKQVGFTGNFNIETKVPLGTHVGLGSTSSLIIGVLEGMNQCLGCPLTFEQLRMLLGHNYVEENSDNETVSFGYETGMTGIGADKGGIYIVSNSLHAGFQSTFAEDHQVFIVTPTKPENNAETEAETLQEGTVSDHGDIAAKKAHILLMKVIPAVNEKNIAEVGKLIDEMSSLGSKKVEILKQGKDIFAFMDAIRAQKIPVVGMSSIGPSICIVAPPSQAQIVKQVCEDFKYPLAHVTKVNNSGRQFSAKPLPFSFRIAFAVGLPGAGKSTACRALAKLDSKFDIQHIYPGELLRNYRKDHPESEESQWIASLHSTGEVKDKNNFTTFLVVQEILKIAENRESKKELVVFIDGFPRSAEQAELWTEILREIPYLVFHFSCEVQMLKARLTERADASRSDNLIVDERLVIEAKNIPAVCGVFEGKKAKIVEIYAADKQDDIVQQILVSL